MPNIIINNYCNQKCSYCFAWENMKNKLLQKDMGIKTYVSILKYLKLNNDNNVRILWWEPLLSNNISKFIKIATKWWFNIIIFSNVNIDNNKVLNIFKENKWNIRINCNINNKDFYSKEEILRIKNNLDILNKTWVKIILWYNIIDTSIEPTFLLKLAKKYSIKAINLKITNTELWKNLIIDNSKRELWIYIFKLIKKYYKDFFIEISCWLSKDIFTKDELNFIKNKTKIDLKFWCNWNIWKFDINTNWEIFKCFPLKEVSKLDSNIIQLLEKKQKISSIIKIINNWTYSKWICTSYKNKN